MHRVNLQPRAHIQKVGHSPGLQHNVNCHATPWRSIQQVLENLQVREEVHDDGHYLRETDERGAISRYSCISINTCALFQLFEQSYFFFNLETTIAEQKKKTLTASIHNTQVCEYYSNIINNSQNIETHWIEALKVLVPFKADSMWLRASPNVRTMCAHRKLVEIFISKLV